MNSIILLNHETGVFYKLYQTATVLDQIKTEIDNGADLENLSVYKAEMLTVKEYTVESKEYGLTKCRS